MTPSMSYPGTLTASAAPPEVPSVVDSAPLSRQRVCVTGSLPSGAGGPARQDFSLQSAPTLPFNDVRAFAVFARVAAGRNDAIAIASLPFRDQLTFAQTRMRVLQQQRQPVRPYQQLRYWSNVPFRHGSTHIVKYSLTPGRGNPAMALDRRNPHALGDELLRHVNEDAVMSTFDFGLQFQVSDDSEDPEPHDEADNDRPDVSTEDGSNVVTVDFGKRK